MVSGGFLTGIGTQKIIFGPTMDLNTPQQPVQCSNMGARGRTKLKLFASIQYSQIQFQIRLPGKYMGPELLLARALSSNTGLAPSPLFQSPEFQPPTVTGPKSDAQSCPWAFAGILWSMQKVIFFPLFVQIPLKSHSSLSVPKPSPALLYSISQVARPHHLISLTRA